MLVLSRKAGESVELPGLGVKIQILGLRKSRVEVGIDAPAEIEIVRGEIRAFADDRNESPQHPESSQRVVAPRRSLAEDLVRLEAQVSVLSELAAAETRSLAAVLSAETLDTLQSIKHSMGAARLQRGDARPISQLITVRAEVLESLRRSQQTAAGDDLAADWTGGAATAGLGQRSVREHLGGYALTQAAS